MKLDGPGGEKFGKKKFIAVGEASMAIFRPTLELQRGSLRQFCVLNRGDLIFFVGSTPLLGEVVGCGWVVKE